MAGEHLEIFFYMRLIICYNENHRDEQTQQVQTRCYPYNNRCIHRYTPLDRLSECRDRKNAQEIWKMTEELKLLSE